MFMMNRLSNSMYQSRTAKLSARKRTRVPVVHIIRVPYGSSLSSKLSNTMTDLLEPLTHCRGHLHSFQIRFNPARGWWTGAEETIV